MFHGREKFQSVLHRPFVFCMKQSFMVNLSTWYLLVLKTRPFYCNLSCWMWGWRTFFQEELISLTCSWRYVAQNPFRLRNTVNVALLHFWNLIYLCKKGQSLSYGSCVFKGEKSKLFHFWKGRAEDLSSERGVYILSHYVGLDTYLYNAQGEISKNLSQLYNSCFWTLILQDDQFAACHCRQNPVLQLVFNQSILMNTKRLISDRTCMYRLRVFSSG